MPRCSLVPWFLSRIFQFARRRHNQHHGGDFLARFRFAHRVGDSRSPLELMVEISTEHASFFVQNLIAIRAEKRLALVVRRPASYVAGTFTTSP